MMRLAARSAIASTGAVVLPGVIEGLTEASAMRRLVMPWTDARSCGWGERDRDSDERPSNPGNA